MLADQLSVTDAGTYTPKSCEQPILASVAKNKKKLIKTTEQLVFYRGCRVLLEESCRQSFLVHPWL